MIDFSDYERDPLRMYGGANGSKIGIIIDGAYYMLKFAPKPKSKNVDGSYANSVLSEYVACHILDSIGMPVQKTLYGKYTDRDGQTKDAVACLDFTGDNQRFFDFASLKNSVIVSSGNGYGKELSDVLEAIEEQEIIDPLRLKRFFWDMFICDALIGNFDRHNGNWGFLVDSSSRTTKIAPLFDCASSLYPQLMVDEYRKILDDPDEIKLRVMTFPQSTLKINDKKINYYDFISSGTNSDCTDALRRILPRMDLDKIHDTIYGLEGLNEIQKEFYYTMIKERKERILDTSLKIIDG